MIAHEEIIRSYHGREVRAVQLRLFSRKVYLFELSSMVLLVLSSIHF